MTFFSGGALPWLLQLPLCWRYCQPLFSPTTSASLRCFSFSLMRMTELFFISVTRDACIPLAHCTAGYTWAVACHLGQMKCCQWHSIRSIRSKMRIFLYSYVKRARNNHQVYFSAWFLNCKQLFLDCIYLCASFLIQVVFSPQKIKSVSSKIWDKCVQTTKTHFSFLKNHKKLNI